MNTFERRSEIIQHLQEKKRASTQSLSQTFQVSEVTIRNDLKELEKGGWISRVHGGAEFVHRLQDEQSFAMRQALQLEEKIGIAKAAATLVKPDDTIILDSSTTAFQLALQLTELPSLRVVTNNLHVVSTLSSCQGIEVIIVGGIVRGETASVVGPPAEEMMASWHAHQGFFGAAGLTRQRGLTDADIREAQIKKLMIKAVDKVNILLDASKFGNQAFSTFASLEDVNQMFTDNKITEEYVELCREYEIKLSVV
jgi:DeoR family fructose operon transcriptional repressor